MGHCKSSIYNPEEKNLKLSKFHYGNEKLLLRNWKSPESTPLSQEETITSFENIQHIYKFEKGIIDQGKYGTVRKAYLIKNPKLIIAVKTIKKDKLAKQNIFLLKKELEILKQLDHPNVVKFYETYQDEKYFHLCFEYCSGGYLFQNQKVQKQDQEKVRKIIYQILNAISYLHSNGIIHRDIKFQNIMFENERDDASVKLIDFGLSNFLNSNQSQQTVGTSIFISPEAWEGKGTEKQDIWSLGVLTYMMLTGQKPFTGKTNEEIYQQQKKFQLNLDNLDIPKQTKNLLKITLEIDPNKRAKASDCLKEPWFSKQQQIATKQDIGNSLIEIINFENLSYFKQEVFKVIMKLIPQDDIKKITQIFNELDQTHSGTITFQELKSAINKYTSKTTQKQFNQILQKLHIEEDFQITYSKFITIILSKHKYSDELMQEAFSYFDTGNTNYIELGDLEEIFARYGKKIPQKKISEMINEVDFQRDGKISFVEFLLMMKSQKDCHYLLHNNCSPQALEQLLQQMKNEQEVDNSTLSLNQNINHNNFLNDCYSENGNETQKKVQSVNNNFELNKENSREFRQVNNPDHSISPLNHNTNTILEVKSM